ncbi:MAG: VWA domain-containing protein [Bacteroidota bacterium]
MKSFRIFLVIAFFLGSSAFKSYAQQQPQELTRILFLFDCSGSMNANWKTAPKMAIAKKLLGELLDSLKKINNLDLALRCFGHQVPWPPGDCNDTRLEVPFAKKNADVIKVRLNNIEAKGTTPIALSLQACEKDFPDVNARNIIIMITDGIEECKGDPCAISYELQKKGISLKPFIIGIGLDEGLKKSFDCVGTYYDASNENDFKVVLKVVISQVLNNTTCQVNLLDVYGKPTETNVNMTFYNMTSGLEKYDYVHTMNARGIPDTLRLDPLVTYKIMVHTIPPIEKDSVILTPGKHTIIGIDAPQGDLLLKLPGMSDYNNLKCIVRKSKEMNTLNVQDFNTDIKYLVGKYDLEILSLPRMYVNNVDITQSHTTTVQVPQPGLVTIISNSKGYGTIYSIEKNELNLIYNLNENNFKETLVLLPGTYKAVFRSKASHDSFYTIEKSFKVVSGTSIVVNLN